MQKVITFIIILITIIAIIAQVFPNVTISTVDGDDREGVFILFENVFTKIKDVGSVFSGVSGFILNTVTIILTLPTKIIEFIGSVSDWFGGNEPSPSLTS